MLLIWALGFTHFLGGPYLFFKVIFFIAILPFVIAGIVSLIIFLKFKAIMGTANNVSRKGFWIYNKFVKSDTPSSSSSETIHVEATIKE